MAKQKEKPAFVRIQSSKTINVTMGLQCKDVTNPDAHVPDRLKAIPLWPKLTMLIREGTHWYPSEITEWNTVKKMVELGIFTIGEMSDTCDETGVDETKTKLGNNIADAEKKAAINKAAEKPAEKDDSPLAAAAEE